MVRRGVDPPPIRALSPPSNNFSSNRAKIRRKSLVLHLLTGDRHHRIQGQIRETQSPHSRGIGICGPKVPHIPASPSQQSYQAPTLCLLRCSLRPWACDHAVSRMLHKSSTRGIVLIINEVDPYMDALGFLDLIQSDHCTQVLYILPACSHLSHRSQAQNPTKLRAKHIIPPDLEAGVLRGLKKTTPRLMTCQGTISSRLLVYRTSRSRDPVIQIRMVCTKPIL